MLGWFRNRLRDREEWFSIEYPGLRIEGRKKGHGFLHLSIRQSQGAIDIAIEREIAVQLADWLAVNYPSEKKNVVQFPAKLSVLPAQNDTDRDPPTSPGKLE